MKKEVTKLDNEKIYISAFIDALNINEKELEGLKYKSRPEWNSIGHFILITNIEKFFSISLDVEDIFNFDSFSKGKEILLKYGIQI